MQTFIAVALIAVLGLSLTAGISIGSAYLVTMLFPSTPLWPTAGLIALAIVMFGRS
jgi:hypothetical protein